MNIEDPQLVVEFVTESREHLADVENQLLTLESQGDNMDVAMVNTVFRAVHSVKGAAGFFGLDTIQGLAHRGEEILNKLRNSELRPTHVVIDTLLKATDCLKVLLDDVESSNDQDISEHTQALDRILNGETGEDAETGTDSAQCQQPSNAAAQLPQPTANNTTDTSPTAVAAIASVPKEIALSEIALREFLVESFDIVEQFERDLMAAEKSCETEPLVNALFRNIHTLKGTAGFVGFVRIEKLSHVCENILGDVRSGILKFDPDLIGAMLRGIDKVRELLRVIEQSGQESDCGSDSLANAIGKLRELKLPWENPKTKKRPAAATPVQSYASSQQPDAKVEMQSPATEAKKTSPETQTTTCPPKTAGSEAKQLTASSAKSAKMTSPAPANSESSASESTIRVDVSLLDKLMNSIGELVLTRNQLIQHISGTEDCQLQRTTQRLNLITSELQESVMKTRMQPIGNVWGRFPRLVRDLATTCEKSVRIEMEGKETELDKTIIEAIKDPLTHLVRNTVDHGIERSEVRVKNGKLSEGCLTLKAYHEGGQVIIEICDDGAGINVERVRSKALEKGLLTQEQLDKMPDRDVGNLIFLPGFSTAEKVSNVSGRGVGMDVVKTNIEKIGGTVDLQFQPGQGTTIKIKIPLTLAIVPALIISCGHNRYAIPQANLVELVRLSGKNAQANIEWIHNAPVYRLRGRLLPLVYLQEQLNLGKPEIGSVPLNIVVLKADDRQFGLVVDRISDSEEIVVKPLGKQLKKAQVYSGATIMGDGDVALILDVTGLAHTAKVSGGSAESAGLHWNDKSTSKNAELQTFLIAGVGDTQRYALQLSQVTRLERILTSKVELASGQEVVQYRGDLLALTRLSEITGTPHTVSNRRWLDVIVYTVNGRNIGIVVDRIIDIVEESISVTRKSNQNGITASVVISNYVADLIDLGTLVQQFDSVASDY